LADAVRRGDIWTVAAPGDYSGKPRPAVIVQDDSLDATQSVTICLFTTDPVEAPLVRLPVLPTAENGLREPCRLMVDKLTTVHRSRLGTRVGTLEADSLSRLAVAIVVFLGLATARQQHAGLRRTSPTRPSHPPVSSPRRRGSRAPDTDL
jgi:mRNA interferase MazF